jgi:hypothetical protein
VEPFRSRPVRRTSRPEVRRGSIVDRGLSVAPLGLSTRRRRMDFRVESTAFVVPDLDDLQAVEEPPPAPGCSGPLAPLWLLSGAGQQRP